VKVIILAGGMGTRLAELTDVTPKPMVEVGRKPLLWHIMKIYSAHQFDEFFVALGFKGEVIKDYFLNFHLRYSNFSIRTRDGYIDSDGRRGEDWTVRLVDTGLNTETGGRIKRFAPWIGNEPFMMTYGDGVANVNIKDLVAFHRSHGKLATVTAVRPPSRFGELSLVGDQVEAFVEKPQIGAGWINGGFFVFEAGALEYIEGDDTVFERGPLARLAEDGQLVAYRHDGFWQGVDTLRDIRLLQQLWDQGNAPWKVWEA